MYHQIWSEYQDNKITVNTKEKEMNDIALKGYTYLAADWDTNTVIDQSGGAFDVVSRIFAVIGTVIIIITLWRAIQGFAKGDIGKAARTIIGGLVAAILCFNLTLPIDIVKAGGSLAKNAVCTVTKALDENATCTT